MDLGLNDQVVFITGASRGIGRATAELLVGEGCRVAITGRDEETLRRAGDELGGEDRVLGVQGDMTRNEDIERAVDATIERFGHVDVLVTCAGSSPGGLLENLTEEEWFGSLNLKFMGYVRSCRAVIPHMLERGGGTIVLVVGNDGLKPSYWEMTAGAANAADINFASSLAEQYGPKGIRVNTVNPGPVDTDRWDGLEKAFARDKGCDQETAHELAVASIMNLRDAHGEDVRKTFGQFLSSFRVSHPVPPQITIGDLARDVHRATARIKREKLFLTTLGAIAVDRLVGRFQSREQRMAVYAKSYPVGAGVSSLNVNALWRASDGSGAPRYIRGVPTGPASPIVVAVTTSGDTLCAGITYRTAAAGPDDILDLQAHIKSRIRALK